MMSKIRTCDVCCEEKKCIRMDKENVHYICKDCYTHLELDKKRKRNVFKSKLEDLILRLNKMFEITTPYLFMLAGLSFLVLSYFRQDIYLFWFGMIFYFIVTTIVILLFYGGDN